MKQKKVLLMGGPGTGKSSLLGILEQKGYCCMQEISREVTLDAQKTGAGHLFLTALLLFSEIVLNARIKQFQHAEKTAGKTIFFDRGIPDVTAYMDHSKVAFPKSFTEANNRYRYDEVFIFPVWKEIYSMDNERYESYEQALEIQEQLRRTYTNLGYHLIPMPKADLEKRTEFILQRLNLC